MFCFFRQGLLLKERIWFLWQQIISYKSSPYFGKEAILGINFQDFKNNPVLATPLILKMFHVVADG